MIDEKELIKINRKIEDLYKEITILKKINESLKLKIDSMEKNKHNILKEIIVNFFKETGYNDIIIPLMNERDKKKNKQFKKFQIDSLKLTNDMSLRLIDEIILLNSVLGFQSSLIISLFPDVDIVKFEKKYNENPLVINKRIALETELKNKLLFIRSDLENSGGS